MAAVVRSWADQSVREGRARGCWRCCAVTGAEALAAAETVRAVGGIERGRRSRETPETQAPERTIVSEERSEPRDSTPPGAFPFVFATHLSPTYSLSLLSSFAPGLSSPIFHQLLSFSTVHHRLLFLLTITTLTSSTMEMAE